MEAAAQFPTVVFTIGLGIILIYWLFVLLGALDIDLFADDVSGAAKGGAEAVKPGVGDVDHGGLWSGIGLGKVPITISLSAVFFVCWILSLIAMHYAPQVLGDGRWVGAAVLPATLLVGMPVAGLLVRPLGKVFEFRGGTRNADCIGQTCTITTGSVTDGFGQATIEDGGNVLVIQVRCDRPEVFSRGQKALVIEFDNERQAFVVEPVADMLPDAPSIRVREDRDERETH